MIESRQDLSNIIVDTHCVELFRVVVLHEDLGHSVLFAVDREEIFEGVELSDHKVL